MWNSSPVAPVVRQRPNRIRCRSPAARWSADGRITTWVSVGILGAGALTDRPRRAPRSSSSTWSPARSRTAGHPSGGRQISDFPLLPNSCGPAGQDDVTARNATPRCAVAELNRRGSRGAAGGAAVSWLLTAPAGHLRGAQCAGDGDGRLLRGDEYQDFQRRGMLSGSATTTRNRGTARWSSNPAVSTRCWRLRRQQFRRSGSNCANCRPE